MVLKVTLACERYDRVSAIFDGRVQIEGCEVSSFPLRAEESFHRAFNGEEFDITEISCSSYMMTTARGDCPYVAVPAFLSKLFRHSAIYVRDDRGINEPKDLIGKRIGLPEYQMTACLWARGLLEDEYGVRPRDIKWFTGGLEEAGRRERAKLSVNKSVSITPIADRSMSEMLDAGDLDGLVSARDPSCLGRNPKIRRLFPNFREVEAAYYQKTKIFPIMHTLGIRKTLVQQHPWLPVSVYKAFIKAKDLAVHDLFDAGINFVTLPWVYDDLASAKKILGNDFWSYGIEPNRAAIEAMTRYSYTQGLSQRHLTPEEMFHPTTHEMSKL